MLHEDKTEVLVVGAGPVGMVTALLLAEGGIEVKIIDQETRTAAHSHACALHPRTLTLLDQLGLAGEVVQRGRRVDTMAFYEGSARRAELKFSELPGDFPFLLVLPQNELEDLLEQKLKQTARVEVKWSHRLSDLKAQAGGVTATIDKLAETAKGYIVPEWDWTVEKTLATSAAFVVGADGPNSHLRQCLGIESERLAAPELFLVYEFESDASLGNEVRVVLDKSATNMVWPLLGNTCRWSFQWIEKEAPGDFPSKDRNQVVIDEPAVDQVIRRQVQKFLQERAPWFQGTVAALDWSTTVRFEHRLASKFGQGRCWLAGDAGHQTGPVGMQSMNVGLREAESLAGILKTILRENGSLDLLEAYNRERLDEWKRLLGRKGGLTPRSKANPWINERAERILPCLPASGEDLTRLANQLGLDG